MSVAPRESFFKMIWQSREPLLLLHTLHTDQSVNLSIFFMIVFFMIVDQNWLFFWMSIKYFNFIAPSHVSAYSVSHVHNSRYQRGKAIDRNTNYSFNIFETYTLSDYSVRIYFLTNFYIQLEVTIIP